MWLGGGGGDRGNRRRGKIGGGGGGTNLLLPQLFGHILGGTARHIDPGLGEEGAGPGSEHIK